MNESPCEVYLNGRFLPRSEASLDIEDRGAMFADGVYEVISYHNGKAFALDAHAQRLRRSLDALAIAHPPDLDRFNELSDELVRRTGLLDADVYWQVTRGQARRSHAFPAETSPTRLAIVYPSKPLTTGGPVPVVRALLVEDQRWARCDIKSLMLLPNVLAKQQAIEAGAGEAIMHRDGRVTEGTSTSVFIVRDGALWTHPPDHHILGGITRSTLLTLAAGASMPAVEKHYTVQEMLAAEEVFLCGTTTMVAAVTEVSGTTISDGRPGPITTQLHGMLVKHIARCSGITP